MVGNTKKTRWFRSRHRNRYIGAFHRDASFSVQRIDDSLRDDTRRARASIRSVTLRGCIGCTKPMIEISSILSYDYHRALRRISFFLIQPYILPSAHLFPLSFSLWLSVSLYAISNGWTRRCLRRYYGSPRVPQTREVKSRGIVETFRFCLHCALINICINVFSSLSTCNAHFLRRLYNANRNPHFPRGHFSMVVRLT